MSGRRDDESSEHRGRGIVGVTFEANGDLERLATCGGLLNATLQTPSEGSGSTRCAGEAQTPAWRDRTPPAQSFRPPARTPVGHGGGVARLTGEQGVVRVVDGEEERKVKGEAQRVEPRAEVC